MPVRINSKVRFESFPTSSVSSSIKSDDLGGVGDGVLGKAGGSGRKEYVAGGFRPRKIAR